MSKTLRGTSAIVGVGLAGIGEAPGFRAAAAARSSGSRERALCHDGACTGLREA